MLEQGSKFASWEDVFPDVEGAAAGAEGQGVLLADSDDSDDESFKVRTRKRRRFFAIGGTQSALSCEGYDGLSRE